jgi:hypothetical protein
MTKVEFLVEVAITVGIIFLGLMFLGFMHEWKQ